MSLWERLEGPDGSGEGFVGFAQRPGILAAEILSARPYLDPRDEYDLPSRTWARYVNAAARGKEEAERDIGILRELAQALGHPVKDANQALATVQTYGLPRVLSAIRSQRG